MSIDAQEAAIRTAIANALMGGLEGGGRGFDALFAMQQAEAIVKALKIAEYEIKRAWDQMAAVRFNDPIEPMDLANMRANGVRSLAIYCHKCHHETVMNVDHLPGDMTVPSFGPRMVCTKCGTIGADVRPNWKEKA